MMFLCIFYFYILSCEFKTRLFYFYGTHGLSFSTPLSTFIFPSSVFEKVKIDKIYKDDLKNQEMVVKQQLSKSIKNDISFEKKLHDEVPSGKNYIYAFFK
jgi:hypothetical protein